MNAENRTPPTQARPHTWRPDPYYGGFVCEEEYGGCALWVSEHAYILGSFPRDCHWLPALHCEAGSGSGGAYNPHDVVTLSPTGPSHGICVECEQRWTPEGKTVPAPATPAPPCEFMGDNAEDCLESQGHTGAHRIPWEREDRPGELWYVYYTDSGTVITTEDSQQRYSPLFVWDEEDREVRHREPADTDPYYVPLF
ncbi:hypothetical protein CFP71_42745 [Amycolatopsis thailandensis]|uniref:Uncharacterized protein n=2 Tax=Amycolatopsis thailandensis TaxID=589330 RepID=A0A229R3Y7_9PSEU|nr:hypothetical protein CFP71_42745 [Amycolatopsis thailandensis]